jgi:hypothetical protein
MIAILDNSMCYKLIMLAPDLRKWRISKRYTQEEACRVLCVTLGHYRKMEYALVPISYRTEALIKALNVASDLACHQ